MKNKQENNYIIIRFIDYKAKCNSIDNTDGYAILTRLTTREHKKTFVQLLDSSYQRFYLQTVWVDIIRKQYYTSVENCFDMTIAVMGMNELPRHYPEDE